MERHVAFVALAEIGARVLGPLVRFGEQHAVGIAGIEFRADIFQHRMGLRQILVIGAVALNEIGNGVETQAVDPISSQ